MLFCWRDFWFDLCRRPLMNFALRLHGVAHCEMLQSARCPSRVDAGFSRDPLQYSATAIQGFVKSRAHRELIGDQLNVGTQLGGSRTDLLAARQAAFAGSVQLINSRSQFFGNRRVSGT